jgi:lysozyme
MSIRPELIEQLRRHEGVRLKPYRDTVGKITIGVGRNLDDVGISNAEVDLLLQHDCEKVWTQMSALPWFLELDPVRQDVLLNMCFNLGYAGLMKFKNTLGLIQRQRYAEASIAMLGSKWARQVGKRANELADQMRTGMRRKA